MDVDALLEWDHSANVGVWPKDVGSCQVTTDGDGSRPVNAVMLAV